MWWQQLWDDFRGVITLQYEFYGNSLQQWLAALLVFAIAWLVLRLVKGVVRRRAATLVERRGSELARGVVDLMAATKWWFLLVVSLYLGSRLLVFPHQKTTESVHTIAVLALVLQAAVWGNVLITFSINRYVQKRLEIDAASVTMMSAVGFIARMLLWSLAVLLMLDNLGVEVTALVAGLGVGGIAVALAAQNVLGDLFASLSIVLDKPFVMGDFIVVGDFLGTVEHVGLKTTRLRSLSGEQLVFSNNDLLQSRIRNFKRMFERRILFKVGVTYDTPYEKLQAIPGMVRETVEAQENARFDRAHFQSFGDFALIFEVVYYVTVPQYNIYMDIQQAINLTLFQRFAAERISFAFPTQTLYVHTQEPVEKKPHG